MGPLTSTQVAAAKALVQQMSGTTANEGWTEVEQLWATDDYLRANGGSTHGAGNCYLAVFGTPLTRTFEIMMTGYYKTVANTYTNGVLGPATLHFVTVERLTFTSGVFSYSPFNQERDAFANVLATLNDTAKSAVKLSSTFSDILLGPGKYWQFPTTSTGLKCSAVTDQMTALVLEVLKTYVRDIDDKNSAAILACASELYNTYVLYSGTNALASKNDYFRIDGPHVWIEFSVQDGVIQSGVQFHSIWRDRVTDYA